MQKLLMNVPCVGLALLFLFLVVAPDFSNAFFSSSATSKSLCNRQLILATTSTTRARNNAAATTAIWLSDTSSLYQPSVGDEGDEGDEEAIIARLLAKGAALDRGEFESSGDENEEEYSPPEMDLDKLEMEVNDWTNLDEIPEFKTGLVDVLEKELMGDREEQEADSSEGDNKKQQSYIEVVDYQRDYDDENDFHVPNRFIFSTQKWGDPKLGFQSSGKSLTKRLRRQGKFLPGDSQVGYNLMAEAGIQIVETSDAYGKSSRGFKMSAIDLLAKSMEDNNDFDVPDVCFTNTRGIIFPIPMKNSILEETADRLDIPMIELYQSKFKFGLGRAFVKAIEEGFCNRVGVIDFGARSMRRLSLFLERNGCTLTSNQFEFSLTNRKKLDLIDECKTLGVVPLIRNPLDKNGLASGRFTAMNPSGGDASSATGPFSFKVLDKLQPLHTMQETVAERVRVRVRRERRSARDYRARRNEREVNTDISTTQVALNYVVAKGGVPLIDVTDLASAELLRGCLGWSLTEEEVEMLDRGATLCEL